MDKQRIQRIVTEFESFYLREQLKYYRTGEEVNVGFEEFISDSQYGSFRIDFKVYCDRFGKSRNKAILEGMTDEQRNRIGALFDTGVGGTLEGRCERDIVERKIVGNKEYEDLSAISAYLSDEQRERLVRKFVDVHYNNLSESEKDLIDKGTVVLYILDLGWIRARRISHREAIDIIIEYAPLFKNEDEVFLKIYERYMDDEIAKTPIEDTGAKISELRAEVVEIWRHIESS